jgi:hypothetical protein
MIGFMSYPARLLELIRCPHDHQDIDVAIRSGFAIRKGAKQDDALGPKLFGNLPGQAAD